MITDPGGAPAKPANGVTTDSAARSAKPAKEVTTGSASASADFHKLILGELAGAGTPWPSGRIW